jgi:hypothetical protein
MTTLRKLKQPSAMNDVSAPSRLCVRVRRGCLASRHSIMFRYSYFEEVDIRRHNQHWGVHGGSARRGHG